MPNEQQERHRRFEERFPLLGTLNGEPIENKIRSFLDEEISLAVANRNKEIVEMIENEDEQNQITQEILGAMEYRGFNDCEKYLDSSIWERIKPLFINLISKNK